MNARSLLAHDPSLLTEAQWSGLVTDMARLDVAVPHVQVAAVRDRVSGLDVLASGPRERPIGSPMLLFVELKTETGKLTPDQETWLTALGLLEEAVWTPEWQPVRARLWRPSQFDEVAETLTGRRQA